MMFQAFFIKHSNKQRNRQSSGVISVINNIIKLKDKWCSICLCEAGNHHNHYGEHLNHRHTTRISTVAKSGFNSH